MPGYSLVPVDYQPDFDDYSLVPVDYDPFAADGVTQQAQIQQPPTPTQPAQPQPQTQPQQPATGAGQPGVNGPATGNSPSGSGGGAGVGNAGSDPSNPTWAQGWSIESSPFGGNANPTPTESPVNQAKTDDQLALIRQKIVEAAQKQIGSGDWHFDVAKGNFGPNTDKCNLFVYDMLNDAGASPGLPNGHAWWKSYPPTAANWADPSFPIPGWRVLGSGETPQPGDVVAQRIQWPNGATGHVMIVGPNASFIGVGKSEMIDSVAAKMMGEDKPGGLLVYRRYGP
jgi:hypothetical protein